ncbi:MAG: hypothetical protein ABJF50_24545 [Paracoccaceae bacterium]
MASNRSKKRKINAKGRNEHSRFVKLDHYLLQSDAYRLLSPPARALLVEFVYRFDGSNIGRLFMSQRDAANVLGIRTHQTAGKYIDELVRRRFLEVVMPGSFDCKQRHATVFRLTMVTNSDQSGPASKEFMRISVTEAERQRLENSKPSWLNSRPNGMNVLPVGYVDAMNNQLRDCENSRITGVNDCTTYNIPRDGGETAEPGSQCNAA